ncbi:uncharacterized protein TRIADDRAFT_54983 [Trichoplax adhaerens]|uniref:Uncharacterized protein n=1 Tax=Trichoplax adhaerens TaxID=10228 RepID=B3RQG8_TRIAD|nr:hypothetical protein TRIADDRAFT_54983 [Trichoplax adhaerens]EDV27238.1 hypothetical protein TRIADDRAFT_54983 [Trichoplax adhaerens]|eukprot:XP_002111234.1 hypothetical protein TRIADDRAFT_54983 [Trichoplax adhaerens]
MSYLATLSLDQQTYLDKTPSLQPIGTYINSRCFPNMLSALQASNIKFTQLLECLTSQQPLASGSITQSLTSLNDSLTWCGERLESMKRGGLTQIPTMFDSVSVEYVTTGLSPEREDKTETDTENIRAFEEEMGKAAKFQEVFKNIQAISKWPKYWDVQVMPSFGSDYSVTKKSAYAKVEYVAIVFFLLIAVFLIQLVVRSKLLPYFKTL